MKNKRKRHLGQSLVEFALSVPLLILLFSSLVDLGRVYFAQVQLQSAISEGTRWATNYPVCLANTNNYQEGVTQCQQSNAIDERVLNEDGQLNRNDYLCVAATVTGVDPANPTPGDDLDLKTKFRVKLVTPLMTTLFGEWFVIYADAHDTIRNTTKVLPVTTPIAMTDQGGVTPGCTIP